MPTVNGKFNKRWFKRRNGIVIGSLRERTLIKIAPNSSSSTIAADIAIYAIAFGLASIASYGYIVVAGRILVAEQFGIFNTLLGLITIAGFLSLSMQLVVAQAAMLNPSRYVLIELIRGTARIAFPRATVLTLMAIPIASTIGVTAVQVAVCGAVALVVILAYTASGFLTGIGKIRAQIIVQLLATMLQLGVGWLLLMLGFGVTGALLGYLTNYAALFALTFWIGWRSATDPTSINAPARDARPLRARRIVIATFVLAFCPFALDQLLVQTVAPSICGSYAALATMVKPVFFALYPIITVAYAHLLRLTEVHNRKRFFTVTVSVAGTVLLISGALIIGLETFSDRLTEALFVTRYLEVAPFLGSMAFGVACFSFSTFCIHALIALRNPMGFLPSAVAMAVQIGLFIFHHNSLAALVSNQLWTFGIQATLSATLLASTLGVRRNDGQ